MLLGYELEWTRVMLVAVLGGLLGILMMIPLRRAFVVKQHKVLKYPEGTACAKVLVAGEQGGSNARMVFLGFGVGVPLSSDDAGVQVLVGGTEQSDYRDLGLQQGGTGPGAVSGVVGSRLHPGLSDFGDHGRRRVAGLVVADSGDRPVRGPADHAASAGHDADSRHECRPAVEFVRPLHRRGSRGRGRNHQHDAGHADDLRLGTRRPPGPARDRPGGRRGMATAKRRTDAICRCRSCCSGHWPWSARSPRSNLIPTSLVGRVVGAILVVLFGFLFVTVSSRITGEMGSSSNPISGMTIATLLLTCAVFVILGWIGPEYRLTALMIAGVVCIASSNGGTTSQDLKTGYLVGATPWAQQVAILIGALTSALVIGGTLLLLNWAYTTTSDKRSRSCPNRRSMPRRWRTCRIPRPVPMGTRTKSGGPSGIEGVVPGKYLVDETGQARYLVDPGIGGRMTTTQSGLPIKKFDPPQPRLFAVIIDGIMSQKLPWGLVMLGVALTIVLQLIGVPSLAFAVGVYLPLSTTLPIFLGGVLRAVVDHVRKFSEEESDTSPGVLMSTGLIAGGSLAGIGLVALVAMENFAKKIDFSTVSGDVTTHPISAFLAFAVLMAILAFTALRGPRPEAGAEGGRLEAAGGRLASDVDRRSPIVGLLFHTRRA